jgi:general secretion pathway protein G
MMTSMTNPSRKTPHLGFTLIELVVVMSLIALLLTLAVPRYFNAIDNSRLAVQKHNIAALRDSIDKFYGDTGRYPETLAELVSKRYLREVPQDPLTEAVDWIVVPPTDTNLSGVYDIKSAYKAGDASIAGQSTVRERTQARDPAAPTANAPLSAAEQEQLNQGTQSQQGTASLPAADSTGAAAVVGKP